MDLHDIARQVASTAGADFAFVLSQAGLLVTHDAPRDMPDSGRTKILWACPSGKNGEIAHLEMPRQELVPFGGAAPIDVFAIRVEDTAILVAAMASWNDKSNVVLALTSGASGLAEMIKKAKRARAQKHATKKTAEPRRERSTLVPGEPRRERTSALPGEPRRERASALPKAPKDVAAAKKPVAKVEAARADGVRAEAARVEGARPRRTEMPPARSAGVVAAKRRPVAEGRPRVSSEPEIEIGEASVGRETLYAIEAAFPRVVPPRAAAGPSPEGMRVQLDSIGRETLMEIETIEATEKMRGPTVDEPLVMNERRTLPWVDTAGALKRTLDAKAKARAVAAPEVRIEVEEMDPDALERALREDDAR